MFHMLMVWSVLLMKICCSSASVQENGALVTIPVVAKTTFKTKKGFVTTWAR